jgi:hypothetical protein
LFPLPVTAQQSKTPAEYLIVEQCDQLLIYNKYQQRITQQEKKAFVPFVPLRVVESQGILNDNYTPCMKVELDGNIFYLIKNDNSTLIGEGKLGVTQIHRNAILLMDTVQLVTNRSAVFISPDHSRRITLPPGKKLIRYFQDGNLTYVRPLATPQRFGWARLDGMIRVMSQQGNERESHGERGLPDKTLERITMRFKELNTVLAAIFLYFNTQSNQKKAVPQWHYIQSGENVVFLLEPKLYGPRFQESDQYVLRDLENILFGTEYAMSYTPGKIEILRK